MSYTIFQIFIVVLLFKEISVLQMDNVLIRGRKGTLHFIRFPTSEMGNFLALAKSKGMATLVTTVCATGGGAYKFEDNFRKVSNPIYEIFNDA